MKKVNRRDLEIFRNGTDHQLYHLKALIALEQLNTSVVEKKKKSLDAQNFDGEANWSGAVNFYCTQMSLVMSVWVYLGDD